MSFHVKIFLEPLRRGIRMKKGVCGYVVEYTLSTGRIVTRDGRVLEENTTGNRLHILALIRALGILKAGCEITVHTYNAYLESLVGEWLPEWEGRGWKTAKGSPCKDMEILKELFEETGKHKIGFVVAERHIYTEWLLCEMEKEEKYDRR